MTTSRRALARREVAQRRRAFLQAAGKKRRPSVRLRGVEFLESRTMLAADGGIYVSDYWNYQNSTDVNADGNVSSLDLLAVVNEIASGGARQLSGKFIGIGTFAATATGPEGEAASGPPQYYVDTNNDGVLNSLDLLAIVNEMTAEGEGTDPYLMRYKIEPVIAGTNTPLPTDAMGRYMIQKGDYYELRVQVQDTGVNTFSPSPGTTLTRGPDVPAGSAFGVATAFLDLAYDKARTNVQVTETQIVEIFGSPTDGSTTFRLTFNGQQTAPITYSDIPVFTAINIRDALVNLSNVGRTAISNLRNVEVEPETTTTSTRFRVRFIHDLANQDFANMTASLTTAAGATSVQVTTSVEGDPSNPASFREMFRGRIARNQESAALSIINNPQFFDHTRPEPFVHADDVAFGADDAGSVSKSLLGSTSTFSSTQLIELFRLRMTADDGDSLTPVSFVGSVTNLDISNYFNTIHGFTAIIPASRIVFDQNGDFMPDPAPQLLITEQISAIDDAATINEGPGASVTIDVLANDIDNATPPATKNLVLVTPLTPLAPGQGTISVDAQNRIVYTVPNGDFNGIVTFQYTIRDGVNTSLTDTGTVTVTVKATNDPPVNTVPGTQSMNEDQPGGLVFSAGGGNGISISDVDAGSANVQVTLTAPNGTLTLNPSATGALATLNGNGTGSVVATGTIANLNAALSGLRFTPTLNFNGATTLTIATSDLGASAHPDNAAVGTDTDVININVAAINDAPVNTAPTPRQVDEGLPLTFTGANRLLVTDVDAGTGNIRVTLTTNSTQGGTLSATASGSASVIGNNSQNLVIEGNLTDVNNTLLGLIFQAGQPESVTLTMLTSDLGNTGAPGPLTDTDQVQITVLATLRPRATPDTFNVVEGPAFYDFPVLQGDLANSFAQVTLEAVGAPSIGTTEIIDTGILGDKRDDIVRYTPPANFFGQVTFTYTISETPFTPPLSSNGPHNTAIVTVNIENVPDAPIAVQDGPYNAIEDVQLDVPVEQGVLANDTDADNLVPPPNTGLVAIVTQQPPAGEGTIVMNPNGAFSWVPTPGANFDGPSTSFKYQARDPEGNLSNEITVTINVAAVNDAPVAVDDGPGGLYRTAEDTDLSIPAPGVLSNDTDVDSPAGDLTVQITQQPLAEQGTVTLNPDGSFVFDPALNFNGEASFKYVVFDNDPLDPKQSNEATVRITVFAVNDAPVASPAEFTVEEGAQVVRTALNGLRTFVADPDEPAGFTGTINLNSGLSPNVGTLNLQSDGSFTYTAPSTVITGFDVTFTYTAFDGEITSNVATVTFHITPFNDPPIALPDGPFNTTEDPATPLSVAAPGVLDNDTDEETPSTLEAVLVSNVPASAGNVVLNLDGSFDYTPAANFFGSTSFTYQARDEGGKLSNIVTVSLFVQEVNDPPIANDDNANFLVKDIPNQPITPDPLANDSKDVDANVPGEVLSIFSVNPVSAQNGTVTLVGGTIFYTPAPGFFGFDSIEYTISDRAPGDSPLFDTATIFFEVKDFIPKTVSGTVYIDANNNGVRDPGESPLAGVRVDLVGATLLGAYAAFDITDANGFYSFSNLAPGNYDLTQVQPLYLTPGIDSSSTSSATAVHVTNVLPTDNKFQLDWAAPDFTGDITELNFGERGVNAGSLADSTGLLLELLASSDNPQGMILSADALGNVDWSYCLNGWTTTALCKVEVAPNGSVPSLLVTVNGVQKRIYQDPSNNHGGNTPPSGSLARFRILGKSAAGDYIIRLDGSLSDFGFTAAIAPVEMGEGEAAVEMADGQYRQAADAVFSEESWA